MKRVRILFLVFFALLFAISACATTTAYISYTAPVFNAVQGSCIVSGDTLRDLKEIVLEGRRTGTLPWTTLARRPVVRGAAYTDTLRGITEQFWDFRTLAFDSTGNASCADSLIGVLYVRLPGNPSGLRATGP